jgi:hypothetical protein
MTRHTTKSASRNLRNCWRKCSRKRRLRRLPDRTYRPQRDRVRMDAGENFSRRQQSPRREVFLK